MRPERSGAGVRAREIAASGGAARAAVVVWRLHARRDVPRLLLPLVALALTVLVANADAQRPVRRSPQRKSQVEGNRGSASQREALRHNQLRPGIIATIGPRSESASTLRRMIRGGMKVARINMSHNTRRTTPRLSKLIRDAARAEGESIPILYDLPGGKVRLGRMGDAAVTLRRGQRFDLRPGSRARTTAREAAIGYRDLAQFAEVGESVLLDDGRLELRVVEVKADRIRTEVVRGGDLRSNMGASLKNVELPFPAMTRQDRRKLEIAVESGADWIGVSMVQSERNIRAVRRALGRLGAEHVKIVAKIESRAALENLDAILDASDGVMIARGDLSAAVGPRNLQRAQARIAAKALEKGVPFITASNLVSATADGSAPSKANAKDVARAVSQRPDWLMLNETAMGKDPGQIVEDASGLVESASGR